MAQLIALVIVGIFMALPAALIAYIIINIFPSCNYIVLAIIPLSIIIFLLKYMDYKQIKSKKENYEKVGTIGTIIFVTITSLFGVYFVYDNNKVHFFIDNQTNVEKNVFVNGKKINLKANSYEEIKVVEGNVVLKQDSIEKIVVVKNTNSPFKDSDKDKVDSYWIWNVDGKGKYIKTTITYGSKINKIFRESFGGVTENDSGNDYKIITEELFETKADYIFDIPEKLKSSKPFGLGSETKLVLYRYNNLEEKYDKQQNKDTSWKNEIVHLDDSVVVKSSLKKPSKKNN